MNSTIFVFLLGPTNAGKGLVIKLIMRTLARLLKEQHLKVGLISFGQMIRDLRASDPEFEATYGKSIDAGKLVPDHKAIELFGNEVKRLESAPPYDFIIVDGFCRSPEQIRFASENGFIQKKDMVFMIEASIKTCLKRWSRRKTTSERKDDSEMQTFYARYHLHRDSAPNLRHMFKENEVQVIDIDGGHELEQGETCPEKIRRCKMNEDDHDGDKFVMEFVFPDVLSNLLPHIAKKAAKSGFMSPAEASV